MKSKTLISVSVAALAWAMPAMAQTGRSGSTAQDLPKPTTASDQNANPAVPQLSVQESPDTGDGDIIVTGLRRSLQSAQAVKRDSDGIVDAIVDAAPKLPFLLNEEGAVVGAKAGL